MEKLQQAIDNQSTPQETEITDGQVELTDKQNADVQAQESAETPSVSKSEKTEEPEFDVRKSYAELRKEFTRRTQEESKLRKQYQDALNKIDELQQAYSVLMETVTNSLPKKSYDPERFLADLQEKGIEALDPYIDEKLQKRLKSIEDEYSKKLDELAAKSYTIEAHLETLKRLNDPKTYPDFDKLMPTMEQIINDPNCPIDLNRLSIPEIYDAVYKLAKAMHSDEALKKAVELEKKKTEASLAKESATTVAGGGKARGTIDPRDIDDIQKLREYFVRHLGEAE